MAEHDDDHHGNSRAAWVMVGIVLLGAAIMAVGFVIPSLAVILGSVVVIVIGLIGLVSDFVFKAVNRKLFAWSSI